MASRLYKLPRSLRERPLLEKEGNVHLDHLLCKTAEMLAAVLTLNSVKEAAEKADEAKFITVASMDV